MTVNILKEAIFSLSLPAKEDTGLIEVSQKEKDTYDMISLICGI